MEIVDSIVRELHEIESYWDICFPCKCKGRCCVGADVTVYEKEWAVIRRYIEDLPPGEKDILRCNIVDNRKCIFRSADKCLIHEVRPENCRYTPFQYVVTADGCLKYTQARRSWLTGKCRFKSVSCIVDEAVCRELKHSKFASLPNFDKQTTFLSLNWLSDHSHSDGVCHSVSEWLQIEPL